MSETTDATTPDMQRVTKDIKAGGADALADKVIDLMNECTQAHGVFTASTACCTPLALQWPAQERSWTSA